MNRNTRAYSFRDILAAYEMLGVRQGATVILKTDLRMLGPYDSDGQGNVLEAHLRALSQLIDFRFGTLVVSTATLGLCNSDKIFDVKNTPSEMGVLTEHVRQMDGAVRSFHPFLSYTAIGKNAHEICMDVSRHGFGPETPKARLLEMDALFVSIGQHPRLTASVVHHAEMCMGVPYRYVKEFIHPVLRDKELRLEPFYLNVWYRECGNHGDGIRKIFDYYQGLGGTMLEASVGRGMIFSLPLIPYFKSIIQALKQDIYIYLESEPELKPYRK